MNYENKFISSVSNLGRTENGALTYTTSGSALVDYFFRGAVSNIDDVKLLFSEAYKEDRILALKISFYLRDCRAREGQGKRDVLRGTLDVLQSNDKNTFDKILPFIPMIGRWKDVYELVPTMDNESLVVVKNMVEVAFEDSFMQSLAAKWAPRKGQGATILQNVLGLSPRNYRKLIVGLSNTVEQKMCAKQWNDIEFSKLPSRAAKIYQKAFMKNASEKYQSYLDSLTKGETKINSSVLYPHDIVTTLRRGQGNQDALNAQWDALPDYMEGSEGMNVFPVIDLSGSMTCLAYGTTSAMDVSIALGLYFASRNRGAYKNLWCNFSDYPEIFTIKGNKLSEMISSLNFSKWGGSTNIQSTFDLILGRAQTLKVPQEDIPKFVVIVSDMEFNSAEGYGRKTNFEVIKEKYAQSGYTMPTLVFWNAASRHNNTPVTMNEDGVVLIGGYSPSIMTDILKRGFAPVTPLQFVLETIQDKYKYLENLE